MKYTKEYQKDLFRAPTFWLGVVLFSLGVIFSFLEVSLWSYLPLMIVGLFLIFTTKYRIMGRLDERHK